MKANISCNVNHCLNYSNYPSATRILTFTEVFKYTALYNDFFPLTIMVGNIFLQLSGKRRRFLSKKCLGVSKYGDY